MGSDQRSDILWLAAFGRGMTVSFPKVGIVDRSPLKFVPFEPTVDMDCLDEIVLNVFDRVTEGIVPVL
jgi:hypothetical protein